MLKRLNELTRTINERGASGPALWVVMPLLEDVTALVVESAEHDPADVGVRTRVLADFNDAVDAINRRRPTGPALWLATQLLNEILEMDAWATTLREEEHRA